MPKENRKRGRRGGTKRKLEEADEDQESHKRQKQAGEQAADGAPAEDYIALEQTGGQTYGDEEGYSGLGARPFYGLLDEEEQEYFRKAGEVLDVNDFPDAQERSEFVESVFREAEGKELKLANSQSCSRLFERLLCLASPKQLRLIFGKFKDNFVPLVQHRFASHCCETLFTRAAPVVTSELAESRTNTAGSDGTMAECYLQVVEELKEHLGWLLTNKYASHSLRVLLLVLSGQPVSQQAGKSGLHSKKKEQIEVANTDDSVMATLSEERVVPSSFKTALESLIATAVAGLDTDQLRSLSAHPLGNPTLQLLLRLELTQFGKQRAKDESSIIRVLIPEESLSADSPSSSFVVGLMYDPVGSRLLETIIEHAPAKTFKGIYRGIIQPKLGTLIKNDTATYVVTKALLRLGKDELQGTIAVLAPLIPSLAERNRLALIRTLVDHSVYRQADTEPLAKYLSIAYSSPTGFDIIQFLNPTRTSAENDTQPAPNQNSQTTSLKLYASLLAQSLLNAAPPLSPLILDPLTSLTSPELLILAQDTQAAHTLVTALHSANAPIIPRRKLTASFYGHIATLASHQAGSHIIDALWHGTRGLAFMRERVAEELAEAEPALKESFYGKRVWRNWKMDLYRRRRREWVALSKSADAEMMAPAQADVPRASAAAAAPDRHHDAAKRFVDFPDLTSSHGNTATAHRRAGSGPHRGQQQHQHQHQQQQQQQQSGASSVPGERARKHMTALEKARERHAINKARREREREAGERRQQEKEQEQTQAQGPDQGQVSNAAA